jgi:hypothetical protein
METQKSSKKVKTVRFDELDLSRIKLAAKKQNLPEAEIIRTLVGIGLVDLIDGEEEDELLRRRMAVKSPDIEGESFLNALKNEFNI